ncbi:MAG TPA: FAD-dependent oxidoreductase [Acidimicrobiales bacterium]|nr:FAD-dependent oxidoreductase [Acidimicrobiales bacterium]
MRTIAVVGASLAALRGVQALRRDGYDGEITVVGDEPYRPYDRPPLSKRVLTGDKAVDGTGLSNDEAIDALDVRWVLGRSATALDASTRTLTLDDGATLTTDGIVLACGATPRTLPGTDGVGGVHVVRTRDDAGALRADLEAGPARVVVVGAGFIGSEVAASCRALGLEVTLLEAAPIPLGRVLPAPLGQLCADLHRDHGVDLRLGAGVEGIDVGDDGRVRRVRLADGGHVDADVVVVGIGVRPNTDWLVGSGLTLDDGVVCDATTLAAPGITAAGDVARWPNLRYGEVMRVEHWDNAVHMGAHAATRLLVEDAAAEPFAPVPWFWSDQYDRKLQLGGRCGPLDEMVVIDGSLEERRFAALFRRDDQAIGVFGMNRAPVVALWQRRLIEGTSWSDALALVAEG